MKATDVEMISLGGIKCGTTYLYNLLSNEAGFSVSKIKEPCFFSGRRHHGVEWYNGLFQNAGVKCDLSANYIYNEAALQRIGRETDAKLILIVRNPYMRALSHVNMERRKKIITLEKDKSLIDEIIRKSDIGEQFDRLQNNSLINRTLVITFDELVGNTVDSIQRVCEHVGVENKVSRLPQCADIGIGFTPAFRALEKLRNSATEFCLNKFGIHPNNVEILNWANHKYKQYLTKEQRIVSKEIQGYIRKKVSGVVDLNEIHQSRYFEVFGSVLKN